MREMLYRAQRKDDRRWTQGLPAIGYYGDRLIIRQGFTMGPDYGGIAAHDYEIVFPETISEFTGKKDKHGTSIFENDILDDKFGQLYVVDYCAAWAAFRLTKIWGLVEDGTFQKFVTGSHTFMGNDWREWTVIGNIFDNAALLDTPPKATLTRMRR